MLYCSFHLNCLSFSILNLYMVMFYLRNPTLHFLSCDVLFFNQGLLDRSKLINLVNQHPQVIIKLNNHISLLLILLLECFFSYSLILISWVKLSWFWPLTVCCLQSSFELSMMFELFLSLGSLVSHWHLIMIQTLPIISKRHVVGIVTGWRCHLSLIHNQSLFSSN
jgi:hypothetical protein